MLKGIYVHKREEVKVGLKITSEELRNLYSSPNVKRKVRWSVYVTLNWGNEKCIQILVEDMKERGHLGDAVVGGKIISKVILKTCGVRVMDRINLA
jgi:hypothetical protein